MLSYTDLKKGVLFVWENDPWEVLESHFLRMQQRKAVVQTKIKNLVTGKIVDRNWQASDYFEEAEIEKRDAVFIYTHRGEYWFADPTGQKNRFAVKEEAIGDAAKFLKPNTKISTVVFNGRIINVALPIKMEFMVTEAPPAIKGNTAQGGTKMVTIETGATVSTPLFINEGDVIRINTETGEYVERVEKG